MTAESVSVWVRFEDQADDQAVNVRVRRDAYVSDLLLAIVKEPTDVESLMIGDQFLCNRAILPNVPSTNSVVIKRRITIVETQPVEITPLLDFSTMKPWKPTDSNKVHSSFPSITLVDGWPTNLKHSQYDEVLDI